MAQHHWLRCPAEFFESKCFDELLKLRAEKRKVEIGFESQKRVKEEHTRKQEKHQMAKDRHKWDVLLAEAKVDHQQVLALNATHAATNALAAAPPTQSLIRSLRKV